MRFVIAGVVIVVAGSIVFLAMRRRRGGEPGTAASGSGAIPERPRPAVVEFHVIGGDARVHFDVPLPEGDVDEVLASLLGHEAIEVVREKRHSLPIHDVSRVVALGRRGGSWVVAATIGLDTPGTLPAPVAPEHVPHASRVEFDVFDHFGDLPEQAPDIGGRPGTERLGSFTAEMRLPLKAAAALRSQGIDPGLEEAPAVVVGLMRAAGYSFDPSGADTYVAHRGGERTFVRVVPHGQGNHPELNEQEIRKFIVDFGSSGVQRGLLITEKYSPFEIHERERRDPRIRFVTRERLQGFIDALALS